MPNEQLKKEMVERGKGKIAKLTGRIAIYNHSKKIYSRNIRHTAGFAPLRI